MTMGEAAAASGRRPRVSRVVPGFLLIILALTGTATAGHTSVGKHHSKALRSPKATALFAFGDSYADTGNRDKNSSSWHPPYGETWPGRPTGRYSNGQIQTDFLADLLGLPTPTPFVMSAVESIKDGINFAVGGSGVTFAYGVTPLGTQVDNFEMILRTGVYSPSFLASSIALVSNVGNDYSSANYSNQELPVVILQVVGGVAESLQRIYELGIRNVLVANLPPLSCLPQVTMANNYTGCVTTLNPPITLHNSLLEQAVVKLNQLPGANFIILDESRAFNYIFNNTVQFGLKEKLAPCCRPLGPESYCGTLDQQGNPLYKLCDNPALNMYWDTVHPTESTWSHVVGLFKNKPGFVIGAATLELWLYENSLRPVLPPAPAPYGPVVPGGAVGQLETAFDALISQSNYSEATGLLQAINLDEHLAGYPEQEVTVFLPNNVAFYSLPAYTINQIYAQDQVIPVASFHVVKGYYNSSQFTSGVRNFTTISGLQLSVTSTPTSILVGPEEGTVVSPDLYSVPGQVVIHGIDKLLFPPY